MSGHVRTVLGKAEMEQGEGQGKAPVCSGDPGKVDEEFAIFMKEIQELDSQREAEADPSTGLSPSSLPAAQETQVQHQLAPGRGSSLGANQHDSPPDPGTSQQQQQHEQAIVWQAVVDPASGKTYYWNVVTDEVTWDAPQRYLDASSSLDETRDPQEPDLQQWAASTFRLTQELPTCTEKVQQLMLQLDFMEDELDAVYERSTPTQAAPPTEEAETMTLRLQRFRSLKRRREQQRLKPSQEGRAGGSDDELLKELIDLQLQQDQQPGPAQCTRCRQRIMEARGTQNQQAKVTSVTGVNISVALCLLLCVCATGRWP